MFSAAGIARAERLLVTALGSALPGGRIPRYPIDECWDRRDQLADAMSPKGQPLRALTPQETAFIFTERLATRIDFRYWLERYAFIAKEEQEASPLTPLWRSQEQFLARCADIEARYLERGHPDGILVNVLKARQLGLSTLTEAIVAHKSTTQPSIRGLIAADVKEQSEYLMSMAEMIIDGLPWWLRPEVKLHQTGAFWSTTETNSTLRVAWGKSSRGGLKDDTKAKGNLGRGKTFNVLHLSELSTWEKPEQIDDGLLPGVPRRPHIFGVFESTAKGRHDWWHKQWLATDKGVGRFHNIFIPWYIEPDKYWAPAPDGWEPDEIALVHAQAVEVDSPKWCLGQTVRLTREQLYWYQSMRAAYEEKGELYKFYEEYPATPEEAFQHAGRSIFPPAALEACKRLERPPVAIAYIEPAKDIAQLQAWERIAKRGEEAAEKAEAEAATTR